MLIRLGMLPADADLEELILSLYESSVAAFYDPRTGEFTIITRDDFEFGPDDRFFAAHEYDHALQDQHFDLEGTRITDPAEGDQALAELGLIEGDASALMFEWAQQHLTPDELLEVLAGSASGADQELLDSMPPILRRQLEFPYLDGYLFVLALQQQSGGWPAIDAAFGNRPTTTEQIMHPEKYLAGETAAAIEMPDLAAALGEGWTLSSTQTMGEMAIGVWVADGAVTPSIPGFPAPLPNAEAAAGWNGDRLISLDGPNGAWAVAWQTEWDGTTDADEFRLAADAAMADLPFPHEVTAAVRGKWAGRAIHRPHRERPGHARPAATGAAERLTYIESGAEIPSRPRELASARRAVSTSARRAAEVAGSDGSTTRRSR